MRNTTLTTSKEGKWKGKKTMEISLSGGTLPIDPAFQLKKNDHT
jgi:hypothetical protein